MKRVTVKNLTLQFDVYDEPEDLPELVLSTIELINLALQREPYDISAQIMELKVVPENISLEPYEDESFEHCLECGKSVGRTLQEDEECLCDSCVEELERRQDEKRMGWEDKEK